MKVGIIGGGVAGMVAAYRLSQQGHQVGLYEASPFLGGLVRTFEPGGDTLEAFYHHIFSTDTTIVDLIEELGLDRQFAARVSDGNGLGLYFWLRIGYRPAEAGQLPQRDDEPKDGIAMVRNQKE